MPCVCALQDPQRPGVSVEMSQSFLAPAKGGEAWPSVSGPAVVEGELDLRNWNYDGCLVDDWFFK